MTVFLHAASVDKRVVQSTNYSPSCDADEVIVNSGKGHRIDFAVIQHVFFKLNLKNISEAF